MLQRDGFSSRSSSVVHATGNYKLVGATSRVVLTRSIDALQDLFSIYPKAESIFRDSIRAAKLDEGINGIDFQSKKERMLKLLYLLASYKDLTMHQTRSLCNAVFIVCDEQRTLDLLRSFAMEGNKKVVLSDKAMWEEAQSYAASISDLRFLSFVKTIPAIDCLHDAAVKCKETAYDCLTTQLDSLVHETSAQIVLIQKEECEKQAQREIEIEEEKELTICRAKLVRQIEDLSGERSRSYVTYYSWVKS